MPLSIQKLENIFYNRGYIPSKYYTLKGRCHYIELLSQKNGILFLLRISSSYNFKIPETENVYRLNPIDLNVGDIENSEGSEEEVKKRSDVYKNDIDDEDLENIYERLNVNVSPDYESKKVDISSKLEDNYKKKISIKDISKTDMKKIKEKYRQLNRIKYCLEDLDYKLSIIYKNYLVVLEKDNYIDVYYIKRYNNENTRIMITSRLETFYEKSVDNTFNDNILSIKTSLYNLLNKNEERHNNIFQKIISNKDRIITSIENIHNKKKEINDYLSEYKRLLSVAVDTLKNLDKELKGIDNKNSNVYNDTKTAYQRKKIKDEISEKQKTKEKIINMILTLTDKYDNIVFNSDTIIFDNTIMLNYISDNIRELESQLKSDDKNE